MLRAVKAAVFLFLLDSGIPFTWYSMLFLLLFLPIPHRYAGADCYPHIRIKPTVTISTINRNIATSTSSDASFRVKKASHEHEMRGEYTNDEKFKKLDHAIH
ncbi:hypothetical protein D3C78_1384280 [compost metagenome]